MVQATAFRKGLQYVRGARRTTSRQGAEERTRNEGVDAHRRHHVAPQGVAVVQGMTQEARPAERFRGASNTSVVESALDLGTHGAVERDPGLAQYNGPSLYMYKPGHGEQVDLVAAAQIREDVLQKVAVADSHQSRQIGSQRHGNVGPTDKKGDASDGRDEIE